MKMSERVRQLEIKLDNERKINYLEEEVRRLKDNLHAVLDHFNLDIKHSNAVVVNRTGGN